MKSAADKPVKKPLMDKATYDIHLRVLVCKEDSEFVARALEMDLIGYGKTEAEAIEELKGNIEAQVSFSNQINAEELLARAADQEYFERWEKAQKMAIRGIVLEDKPVQLKARAVILSFSKSDIRKLQQKPAFRQTDLVHA
ncbi:MAG: hypothetical protein QM813_26440 [Verrucomicrobiota bacterium]